MCQLSSNDPLSTLMKAILPGGAKGTRTPDPHTASVVRYQLRHSPKMSCSSKLHHQPHAFKVAAERSDIAGDIESADIPPPARRY